VAEPGSSDADPEENPGGKKELYQKKKRRLLERMCGRRKRDMKKQVEKKGEEFE